MKPNKMTNVTNTTHSIPTNMTSYSYHANSNHKPIIHKRMIMKEIMIAYTNVNDGISKNTDPCDMLREFIIK